MSKKRFFFPSFGLPQFVLLVSVLIAVFLPPLTTHFPQQQWLWFGLTGCLVVGLCIVVAMTAYRQVQKEKLKAIHLAEIDKMTGVQFEYYLSRLLSYQGYKVNWIGGAGDLGVDLIMEKEGVKYAVQVKKRVGNSITRSAVSDAVAGVRHYGCHRAAVITNSYFQPGAEALAASNDCLLIDRDILSEWIEAYRQNQPLVIEPPRLKIETVVIEEQLQ